MKSVLKYFLVQIPLVVILGNPSKGRTKTHFSEVKRKSFRKDFGPSIKTQKFALRPWTEDLGPTPSRRPMD